MRVRRDLLKDVGNTLKSCTDMWCPSETQFGTKWTPIVALGVDLSFNKEKSQSTVEKMWWLYIVQVAISILPSIIACLSKCCSDDDNRSEKRAGVAGGSSSLSTFLIGLFGICAIKFDCKELLMASTITAVISIILTVVYLLIMLCGLCQLCRSADGCCDRLYSLVLFAVGVTWVLASNAINVYLLYLAWPFCFNESLDDTVNKVSQEINN